MDLFLIAHIAGRGVAIESGQVDSVVDIGDVVAVPLADRAVRGLAALRSRVVTVIDTGIALGLDRLVAILAGQSSIREVIAFPKTAAAVDLMTGAPSSVDQRQLDELKLRLAAKAAQ